MQMFVSVPCYIWGSKASLGIFSIMNIGVIAIVIIPQEVVAMVFEHPRHHTVPVFVMVVGVAMVTMVAIVVRMARQPVAPAQWCFRMLPLKSCDRRVVRSSQANPIHVVRVQHFLHIQLLHVGLYLSKVSTFAITELLGIQPVHF